MISYEVDELACGIVFYRKKENLSIVYYSIEINLKIGLL